MQNAGDVLEFDGRIPNARCAPCHPGNGQQSAGSLHDFRFRSGQVGGNDKNVSGKHKWRRKGPHFNFDDYYRYSLPVLLRSTVWPTFSSLWPSHSTPTWNWKRWFAFDLSKSYFRSFFFHFVFVRQLTDFVGKNRELLASATLSTHQSIDRVRSNLSWMKQNYQQVVDWLDRVNVGPIWNLPPSCLKTRPMIRIEPNNNKIWITRCENNPPHLLTFCLSSCGTGARSMRTCVLLEMWWLRL